MSIKDDLHRLVDALPDEQLLAVERFLRQPQLADRLNLQELIAQQAVRPLTDPLASAQGIWPDDEKVDDFLEARERWRIEDARS